MTEEERAEAWKSRALYEEDEKLRMEQRIADALSQTGRWFVQRPGENAHTHRAYVEGCFRCDLSRDEV